MPPSQYTPESQLLAAVDPAISSDDWPVLTLSSVEIVSLDSETPISLLEADAHTPLLLRGKLPSVPRDLSHLRLGPGGPELIEVTNVRHFAYGQYDDGRIDVWAAGAAGWYTVRPNRAYRPVYEEMIAAIEALYYAADTYRAINETKKRKGKRRRGDVSADEVFAGFAAVYGLASEELGRMVFVKHRAFLIKSILQGKEEVDWEKTGIWEWLVKSFGDEVEETRALLREAAAMAAEMARSGLKRKREELLEVASERAESVRSGRSRGRRSVGASTPTIEMSRDSDESERPGKRIRGKNSKSVLRPKTGSVAIEDDASSHGTINVRTGDQDSSLSRIEAVNSRARRSRREVDVGPGASLLDEGIDMGDDDFDGVDSEEDSDIIVPDLADLINSIPVRLRKEHTDANLEGDVWTCPLDGCMHKIYAASEASSQKLIKEHYRVHVNDEDAEVRIQLVRRMEAPGQPVNRLLKKIQETGGKGFPAPIMRRY